MKFYANKLALCSATAFGLAMSATFIACGDENTTEVTEQTGVDILAKGEKLPDCTKDNSGDMLYVADSAAVYYCADGKWATLNGKDGEPGKEGTSTEGKNGTSCTAKTVKDGIEVSCDGKVIGIVKNGTSATAMNGDPGVGCTIDETAGNGVVKVTCGEGDDVSPVTLYKGMCGTDSYDPAEKFCHEGTLYSCGNSPYKPTEQFCADDGNVYNLCGGESYDPTKSFCDDGKISTLCGTKSYNPAKEYCLTLKDKNGESVFKVQVLLIDDRDKNDVQVYKTVEICDDNNENCQTWMAQNLNFNTNTESVTNNICGGASYSKEGDCSAYGRLYPWDVVVNLPDCGYKKDCKNANEGVWGICPQGWHVPSNSEWEILGTNAGGLSTLGVMLRSVSGWEPCFTRECLAGTENMDGIDAYGFSALPAGYVAQGYPTSGESTGFWSSSEYSSERAGTIEFRSNYKYGSLYNQLKYDSYSVRCIKNSEQSTSN